MRRNSAQCNIMMMPGEETKTNKENSFVVAVVQPFIFQTDSIYRQDNFHKELQKEYGVFSL